MIQLIKVATLAVLAAQNGTGQTCFGINTFTPSEIDSQPVANSPLVQMKFISEAPPAAIQGFGCPTQFEHQLLFEMWLRMAGPDPECWANAYNLWFTRDSFGVMQGLKIALQGIMVGIPGGTVGGLQVGPKPDLYRFELGEMRPRPPVGAWTANLCIPVRLVTIFSNP